MAFSFCVLTTGHIFCRPGKFFTFSDSKITTSRTFTCKPSSKHSKNLTAKTNISAALDPNSDSQLPTQCKNFDISRRVFNMTLIQLTGFSIFPMPSHSEETLSAENLIEKKENSYYDRFDPYERYKDKVYAHPLRKIEGSDILYPEWMAGLWKVNSKVTDVVAPEGEVLFGSKMAYDNAVKSIGTSINYEARFRKGPKGIIADRPFNISSITRSVMGESAVLQCDELEPEKTNPFSSIGAKTHIKMSIMPVKSKGRVYEADIIVIGRKSKHVVGNSFVCAETVRQSITTVGGKTSAPASLKDYETICIYKQEGDSNLTCLQRVAAYPVQSRSTISTDVRYYELTYDLIRRI